MSVAAVGCGGTSGGAIDAPPPPVDAKAADAKLPPADAAPPDAPPPPDAKPDAAPPPDSPPKPDANTIDGAPQGPPDASPPDVCQNDASCTATGINCTDAGPVDCEPGPGGCLVATPQAACNADETCTPGMGCTCTDPTLTSTSGVCAGLTGNGVVCSADATQVINCQAGSTDATGAICFNTSLNDTCVAPKTCQGAPAAACACPAPVDASMAQGTHTQGCAVLNQRTCGTDGNVDQCVQDAATGCLVWDIEPVDPDTGAGGNCVNGGSTNPVDGALLCIPEALQCQCPANGSASNFYANTTPVVAAARKDFLTQNGRRTPAVCSYESLTLAVHAAKSNSGPGHSPFARAIMSRVGAAAPFEPVVFDAEDWRSATDDTGTRPMEISTHIRLTTERDPDLGLLITDTCGPETVGTTITTSVDNAPGTFTCGAAAVAPSFVSNSAPPQVGQIDPTLYLLIVNGDNSERTLYFSGVPSRIAGTDVGGKGRGFTVAQGGFTKTPENGGDDNGDNVRPLVVFDGYAADVAAEPRLDRVVIEGGGGDTLDSGTASSNSNLVPAPHPGLVTFDTGSTAIGGGAFLGLVNVNDNSLTGVYPINSTSPLTAGSVVAIYAPQISGTTPIPAGTTWAVFSQGNKNVGLYVGSTDDLFDQGSMNGISGHRPTSGIFDSIIVRDFWERDSYSVGAIVHSTYGGDLGRTKNPTTTSVTFLGPVFYDNYQGMQIDRNSVVHLPAQGSLLASNAAVGLAAPGFLPPVSSSFGGPGSYVPVAGLIAHSGQAGMILPPDTNGDTGTSGRHSWTQVDAHSLMITDTLFDPLGTSQVGFQRDLGREGTGFDNAQANASVFLDSSWIEDSEGTGAVVENGVDTQPQAYISGLFSGMFDGNPNTRPCDATLEAVDCTANSPFGVLSLHASATVIGSTGTAISGLTADDFGNGNGVQLIQPGGHILIDNASHVDHNNHVPLFNDWVDSINMCGDDSGFGTCAAEQTSWSGFGILVDIDFPSDVNVVGSTASNNEEAGMQIDHLDHPWSASLRVEQASAADANGLQGVNAVGNSSVELLDSEFNFNGRLSIADCTDTLGDTNPGSADDATYGVVIDGHSILTAVNDDINDNHGGGVYLNTQCIGAGFGNKCGAIGLDSQVWHKDGDFGGARGPNRISNSRIERNGDTNFCRHDAGTAQAEDKHADGIEVTNNGWLQFTNGDSTIDQNHENGIRVEGLLNIAAGDAKSGINVPAHIQVTSSGRSGLRVDNDGWAETTGDTFGVVCASCNAAPPLADTTLRTSDAAPLGGNAIGATILGHYESVSDLFASNKGNGMEVNESGGEESGAADLPVTFFTTTVAAGKIVNNGGNGAEVIRAPYFTATGGSGDPLTDDTAFATNFAVTIKEGPTLATQTHIYVNDANGVQAGGANQVKDADTWVDVQNAVIDHNQIGFSADGSRGVSPLNGVQLGAGNPRTAITFFRNEVEQNRAQGTYVKQAFIVYDFPNAIGFNGNKIGRNGFVNPPDPETTAFMCNTNPAAPQAEFEGIVPKVDVVDGDDPNTTAVVDLHDGCYEYDPFGGDAAQTGATACNADRNQHCLWNQDVFSAENNDPSHVVQQACRRSYVMSTTNCSSNANILTGYTQVVGNTNLRVGLLAFNAAWVNMINLSWIHGGNLMEGQDWEAVTQGAFASDGPSGAEQTCTAASDKCPMAPPVP